MQLIIYSKLLIHEDIQFVGFDFKARVPGHLGGSVG